MFFLINAWPVPLILQSDKREREREVEGREVKGRGGEWVPGKVIG